MITIWETMYCCLEKYFCETLKYLLSMLAYTYKIIIDCGVGSPVHGREVVDGLNAIEIIFLSIW